MRNTNQFSRTEREKDTQMLCAKFSLVPDNLKRIMHSLRASMLREIRRGNDDSEYESTLEFYKHLLFMKKGILQDKKQEAIKEWEDEELFTYIG